MDDALLKKATDMLLKGATLAAHPCPYCKGVRVTRDGGMLCINCGAQSEGRSTDSMDTNPSLPALERKLVQLSSRLEQENDYKAQQEIIKSISLLSRTISEIRSGHNTGGT